MPSASSVVSVSFGVSNRADLDQCGPRGFCITNVLFKIPANDRASVNANNLQAFPSEFVSIILVASNETLATCEGVNVSKFISSGQCRIYFDKVNARKRNPINQ